MDAREAALPFASTATLVRMPTFASERCQTKAPAGLNFTRMLPAACPPPKSGQTAPAVSHDAWRRRNTFPIPLTAADGSTITAPGVRNSRDHHTVPSGRRRTRPRDAGVSPNPGSPIDVTSTVPPSGAAATATASSGPSPPRRRVQAVLPPCDVSMGSAFIG